MCMDTDCSTFSQELEVRAVLAARVIVVESQSWRVILSTNESALEKVATVFFSGFLPLINSSGV